MVIIRGKSSYGRSFNYVKSLGNLSAGSFTVGASVTKDMASSNRPAPAIYPGTSGPGTSTASYWPDWGEDIFDGWGYFYIYDVDSNAYSNIILSSINQADGTIATQSLSAFSRTFTIKHGYPVQGIYKIDISVNDDKNFIFGANGNMGSDSATSNNNLTQAYNLLNESLTLYYNYNYQTTNTTEAFYVYMIPYEKDKNKNSITYTRSISSDNLVLYSVPCKKGITVYFAKRNNVKDWIINDLNLTS